MKLVIVGSGGMGAVSLSHMIAYMAIEKGLHVKSTEIHGMAKKGGLVEIYMKIDEGASPFISQSEADFVILMDGRYLEYASAFLSQNGVMVSLSDEERKDIVRNYGDLRFASAFMLGRFLSRQDIFTMGEASRVIKRFKSVEKNLKALKEGMR